MNNQSSIIKLSVVGFNHEHTPYDLRSKWAINADQLPHAYVYFRQALPNHEHLILATCNRLEVYSTLLDAQKLAQTLVDYIAIGESEADAFTRQLYQYDGRFALKHLMSVAAGLNSLIVGEPQIFGQLKSAHQQAVSMGTAGPKLNTLLSHVYQTAKAVRSDTAIGQCPISIAFSAIHRARDHIDDLHSASVHIIGAGQSAELLLKHLKHCPRPFNNLHLFNRTLVHAQSLAERFGAQAHGLDQLQKHLAHTDLLIAASTAPDALVSREQLKAARAVNTTPLLCIDLGMPRNLSADIKDLPGVSLITIDDLHGQIEQGHQARQAAAIEAQAIIEKACLAYGNKRISEQANPTIRALRTHTQKILNDELSQAQAQIDHGNNAKDVLDQFAHRILQKWLHAPSHNLREHLLADKNNTLETIIAVFDLPKETERE